MTTISDFSSLVTAATEYLAREEDTTLINRIPTFIQLTEAKMNRELRCSQMEVRATTTVNIADAEPEYIEIPNDYQSIRRIRVTSHPGKPRLEFKSGVQLDEYRASISDQRGCPKYFTIFGDEIELCPTPNESVDLELVYRADIPALSVSNPTNWVLAAAPDLYLYGVLLEAAPYIKEDARIQTWGLGFSTALDGLNKQSMDALYGPGPLQMRVSGRVV